MKGILELAKEILRLPASIGIPEDSDFISGTSISDPTYSSVIGTLLLSQKYGGARSKMKLNFSASSFWGSIKNVFGKIVP
jgi:cell division ATPase FtsA